MGPGATSLEGFHPAVRRSLERAGKRAGRKFDLKKVASIVASGGIGSLEGLERLSGLASLTVSEWNVPRGAHPTLSVLILRSVAMQDLAWFAELPSIGWLTLAWVPVVDLGPLLEMPDLWKIQVEGCPVEPGFYYDHLPHLPGYEESPNFPENAWKVCWQLREAGLPVVTFMDDYGELRLKLPGYQTLQGLMSIPAEEVTAALAAHAQIDLPTFINETRVRRGSEPLTLEQMTPKPE